MIVIIDVMMWTIIFTIILLCLSAAIYVICTSKDTVVRLVFCGVIIWQILPIYVGVEHLIELGTALQAEIDTREIDVNSQHVTLPK